MSSGEVPVRYTAGELREKMPLITAWLDGMRGAFGTAVINDAIKGGIAGRSSFHAVENGIEVGTRRPEPECVSSVDSYLRLLAMERECAG